MADVFSAEAWRDGLTIFQLHREKNRAQIKPGRQQPMTFDPVWQDREDAARLRRSLPIVTTNRARLCLQGKLVELENRILAATQARESRASLIDRKRPAALSYSSPRPTLLLLDRQLVQNPQQGQTIARAGGNHI
jgi:hypothetical protein